MTEVMPQAPSAVSDRSHLYAFLTATDASAAALERPVCRGWVGDYQISAKTGHVLANGAGYRLPRKLAPVGMLSSASRETY